jgi:hypothetical protein
VDLSIIGGSVGAVFTAPAAASVNAAAGVASFNGVAIDLVGTGYQLQATAAGVVGTVLSATFDVTLAEMERLASLASAAGRFPLAQPVGAGR